MHRLVRALLEDENGTVWVGTNEGLFRYDARLDRFDAIPHESEGAAGPAYPDVHDLKADADGVLWLLALSRDGSRSSIRRYDLAEARFRSHSMRAVTAEKRFRVDRRRNGNAGRVQSDPARDDAAGEAVPRPHLFTANLSNGAGGLWASGDRLARFDADGIQNGPPPDAPCIPARAPSPRR